MFRRKGKQAVTVVLALICVAGAWFLGTWLLSVPELEASGILPRPLTFDSPIGNPHLALGKRVDNSAPGPGHEIIYTLAYSNTNAGSQAFNVRLYDFLPAGVQLVSTNPPYAAYADGILLFTAPSVGPGTVDTVVTIRTRVLEGYAQLYNHALVAADGVTSAVASLLTEVSLPSGELQLTKNGYSVVLPGRPLVYTLRCRNTGDAMVNNVVLADVLPTGVSWVAASPSPDSVTVPLLQWSIGNLGVDQVWQATITTTAPTVAGVITNTAIADAESLEMMHALFATEVVSEGAILRVEKSASSPAVDLGGMLVYTLDYRNDGDKTATGVVLTDTFPSDLIIMGFDPTGDVTAERGIWTLPSLNPGNSGRIVITTTVSGDADRMLLNVADTTGPGSYPGHAELETTVRSITLYLPLVLRNY